MRMRLRGGLLAVIAMGGCAELSTIRASSPVHESLLSGSPGDIAFCFTDRTAGDWNIRNSATADGSVVKLQFSLGEQGFVHPLWEATLTREGAGSAFEMRSRMTVWGDPVDTVAAAIQVIEACGTG